MPVFFGAKDFSRSQAFLLSKILLTHGVFWITLAPLNTIPRSFMEVIEKESNQIEGGGYGERFSPIAGYGIADNSQNDKAK